MKTSISPSAITVWEMDRLLRKRTIENIINSAETLNALRRLLLKLEKIIIQDKIQELVSESLYYLSQV